MTASKSMLSQLIVHFCASLLIFLASGQEARAADDPQAAARASLERIQSLRMQRPDDGLLVFYEAITRIALGERDAAFALLRTLKSRKLGLIPLRDFGFESVWGDPGFQRLRKELTDNEPRTLDAPVAFRLTNPKLIPEGIGYDEKRDRFFIGSVAQKKIVVTDRKGDARDFSKVEDRLDCVLGVIVDPVREQLYAISTNGFLDEAKTQRRNAVFRYDLKTGHLADRFDAPEAMQLNDIAIAPNGTVYATDSMSSTLFRKKPDEKTLTRFGSKGAGPCGKWHHAWCGRKSLRRDLNRYCKDRHFNRSANANAAARHCCDRWLRRTLLARRLPDRDPKRHESGPRRADQTRR